MIHIMNGVRSLQLTTLLTDHEIENFLSVWYERKSYGLVIKNLKGDIEVTFGDWIIQLQDNTYSVVSDANYSAFLNLWSDPGKSNV